jgi:uncharacterized spore protein YtfJ
MPDVDEMWRGARDAMTVKRVYGDPVQSDGVTLVPAAAVRGGAGGGGEGGPEGGGGGGFGIVARPIGAYVIRDGSVSWRPAVESQPRAAPGRRRRVAAGAAGGLSYGSR